MAELRTRWGRDLDPDAVLQAYPRPQLVRDSYLNLNGWWEHAFTDANASEPGEYDGPILVPFSPEAPLSGVGRQLQPDEKLWYRGRFSLPDGFAGAGQRVLLHFGAVDQSCEVQVNGVQVPGNEGGYWAFWCDITDELRPGENVVVVEVRDLSDGRQHAFGKQKLERGAIWYTAQSGIWQTVWLEAVAPSYVERLRITPHLDDDHQGGELEVTVHTSGFPTEESAWVTVAGRVVEATPGKPVRIRIDDVRLWTPEDPHLYDVEVAFGQDQVSSYAGMRSIGTTIDADGQPRVTLNGEAVTQIGVLDQGYWPDGLMTAPSDEALVFDIESMKRLGFTMLRKHIKVEPMRWYHHCDRLGMLVWQDAVNGGGSYRRRAIAAAWDKPFDDTERLRRVGRGHGPGRALFRRELVRTLTQLHNAPSIVVWVPFNEGWGQFDAAAVAAEVAAADPSRLVDHASGWHDQGAGDFWSLHVYQRDVSVPPRSSGDARVLALSEYGGVSLPVPGHVWNTERTFGHGSAATAEEWLAAFTDLHARQLAPAVKLGLSATVYTQLSDIEDEVNGLFTYDRERLKAPEDDIRTALSALRAPER